MNATPLRCTDVSLTDGQSALWGGAMTTPMVYAVAARLAQARPAAIEVASAATLQQCLARNLSSRYRCMLTNVVEHNLAIDIAYRVEMLTLCTLEMDPSHVRCVTSRRRR